MSNDDGPLQLLERARAGDDEARGRLFDTYRNFLRVMSRSLIGTALRARLDPSDVVQDTLLKAHRGFADFDGATEGEFIAWLRQILVRDLADRVRHHHGRARDVRREESLDAALERSSLAVQRALEASSASPSAVAEQRERAVLLADALEKLPADYRKVFILRSLEHVSVADIAARLGRTPNAVVKLWARAMAALVRELEGAS
jgi:RNA polymerase sigma-70 factor (ECF subfamily)